MTLDSVNTFQLKLVYLWKIIGHATPFVRASSECVYFWPRLRSSMYAFSQTMVTDPSKTSRFSPLSCIDDCKLQSSRNYSLYRQVTEL